MKKTALISTYFILFILQNLSSVFGNVLSISTPAKQVIIYDHELNIPLFKKNEDQMMKPASMAKVMTAYIVFDRLPKV